MTEKLFLEQAYDTDFEARVVDVRADGSIILDKTLFYGTSGGQPGDCGTLTTTSNDNVQIQIALKDSEGADICHQVLEGTTLPQVGDVVHGQIDWDRRYKHMQMHTAMHLLCSLIVGDVTGGAVGEDKSRLDFNIPGDAVDKEQLTQRLNQLIAEDHPVKTFWISADDLAQKPELVRTMSVKPPTTGGKVRIVQIGHDDNIIDLQPCGGTHVKSTGEIGAVIVTKIENKGKQNRRVNVAFQNIG